MAATLQLNVAANLHVNHAGLYMYCGSKRSVTFRYVDSHNHDQASLTQHIHAYTALSGTMHGYLFKV